MPFSSLIPVGAWLWDNFGKTLADKTADAIKAEWNKFRLGDASRRYRESTIKLNGDIQIMGMARPVPLADIFTEVYILERPTALSRFGIEHLKRGSAQDSDLPPTSAKRIGGLTLVKNGHNLFILGKPGAGKTTFLKYITLKAAEGLIDKVPIYVSFSKWSSSNLNLISFIEERFDICKFPDAKLFVVELLMSGNAIVLFDGLDEVNEEKGERDKRIHEINNFVEKFDSTQCLITCRIAATDYSFEHFSYVEIADFTEEQIYTFVNNWFRYRDGERNEHVRKKFLADFAKDDNKGLRSLARTPLLLTLLDKTAPR